jgi:PAS domain-containing protein
MSDLSSSLALALAESLADGVVVCEAGGTIRWMNPAMRQLLGLAEGDRTPAHREALGLTLGKPWHIPTRPCRRRDHAAERRSRQSTTRW